jgi:phosphatidate phosphatase APP1
MAHKTETLLQLTRDLPNISWLLIGDDGQHDPVIYADFAHVAPEKVRAIAIRQLTPAEQVLAHGTTTVLPEEQDAAADTPWVAAPDGRGLLTGLRALLGPTEDEREARP